MKKPFYNLSNPQKSILLTEQYYENTNINNICGTAIISEKLNFDLLEKAINNVIKENDSFLLKISRNQNKFVQSVQKYEFIPIELVNLNSKEDVSDLENKTLQRVFNIEENLFEFKMFSFPDNSGGFLLNIHHILADGWTLGLTCRKIMIAYSILNNELPEEDFSSSYIDYLESENEYFNSTKFENDKKYWNNVFSTIPALATIPGSLKNKNEFSCTANRKEFIISKELVNNIQEYCKVNKISIFNFFMAVLAIYMYKINNINDFVIGTPILNRTNFKEKNTTGMFINVAPFRININSEETFIDFLNIISRNSRDLLKHQKYSYTNILEDIRSIDYSVPNLYNIVLSYQVTKANNVSNYNYETRWAFNGNCNEDIEIQLYDLDETGSLTLSFDYKTTKYTKQDIKNLNNRLLYIVKQVLNENLTVKDINIALPEEQSLILNDFNDTSLKYDPNITIVKYFEEQVNKTPNNPALTFHDSTLSFKELNEKANSLAHIILENIPHKNSIVPIMAYRSKEVIIGILAILKAGCAYLPIDPDYPNERVEYILNTCNTNIVLTTNNLKNRIPNRINAIGIDLENEYYSKNTQNPNVDIKPEDLSYLIFTSGSTGLPKGVKLTHKNYSNFYNAMVKQVKYLKNGEKHSMISITTISFDIFGFETLISLMCGVHLFLTDNFEQKDTHSLEEIIYKNNIDAIQTTPSVMKFHLENLKNSNNFSNIKYYILAGEQLPKELVETIKKISPHATVLNGYGPSETTIFSTLTDVTNQNTITIGKPIANTQIYVLNNDLNVLPVNTIGEIYIAGDGVGQGYLYRDDLTSKSFLPNPFGTGTLYKTGDIGLWSNDGALHCKGRNDNQIKLRGLRIELGEIEYKINTFKPDISISSVLTLRKVNNRDILHAFISSSEPINLEELKKYLLNNLPNYMVPTSFTVLKEFPKTPNGKIDKKALPQIIDENKIINPPSTVTEKKLCTILEKLIHIEILDVNEDIFNLGVDSLIAIQLITEIKSNFEKNISIKNIFENNSIHELSKFIDNEQTIFDVSSLVIKPCKKQEYYPVTPSQKSIFYSSNISDNTVYNMTGGIEVFEEINKEKIEYCFNELIKKHEAFRTQFKFENGEIVQKIVPEAHIKVTYIDGTHTSKNKLFNSFNTKFDLTKAPLLKAGLAKLENSHYLILISTHHIVCDGSSFQILIDDFCKLYNDKKLTKTNLTYKDYAAFENEQLQENKFSESKFYWENKFNKSIPTLNLPTTYNRPTTFTYTGSKISKTLSKTMYNDILEFCKNNNITPFMFMISVYYILLYKYSDNTEILVGTPVANRNLLEISNIVGMFVNTLVLEANIDTNMTFIDFCKNIKEISLEAFKHQDYPFSELVRNLNIKRDLSRNLVFDTMFTFQNNGMPKLDFSEKAEYFIPDTKISKFDLSLEVMPTSNSMELNFEYCTDLFSKQFINDLSKHYIEIIKNVIKSPETLIKNIRMLSKLEKNKIIYDFNRTALRYPTNKTIPKLFEEQVQKHPDKIAGIFGDTSLTYNEMNIKINNLAHYLLEHKILPGDIIGIMVNRSIEMLIYMMAILKIGATYVPIDPSYPEHRVKYILENSHTKMILSEESLKNKFEVDCEVIDANLSNTKIYNNKNNTNPIIKTNSSDLAYIIYTSGSTGNPKGVMLTHKNVVNFIYGVNNRIKFNKDYHMVSVTTICFDIFVLESLLPLCSGMTTVIANQEEQNIPQSLNKLCLKNDIKILQTTPSKLMLLISDAASCEYVKNLKYILVGGEAVPVNLIKKLKTLTKAKIFNMYGPTETTVWSTIKNLTDTNDITIGTPIANTYTYVLDNNLNILPIGVNGNLYIGGDGVGNGYLNREELTKEKFIDNPFVPDTKMYDTGDVAKLMPNGEIIYIGRSDFQVKIHGLRIELGEIEKQISSFEDISNAAVCVKKDSSNRDMLCAYFMANKKISLNKLKDFLRKQIPEYMIPVYFKQMHDFRYTPNGKIDRKNLPNPEFLRNTNELVKPETTTEKLVTKIVENILAINPISITDNLFDIGADSLTALRLQIELLNENINIPYADIFKYNTIKDLSLRIDSNITTEVTLNDKAYDYTAIDNLISKNNIDNIKNIKYEAIENVILTGSTGFLGSHILAELLDNHHSIVYCLIRRAPGGITIEEKLKNRLNFYFGNKYDNEFGKRIILIESDICDENLKLTKANYDLLKNNANCIINSAANVKHYGYYSDFEKINVNGVKNLINFALKENKKFIQISTASVSGNTLVGEKSELNNFDSTINYTEQQFFVGQSFENVYTYSKFEAEKLVFENIINNNLDGLVLRVGYITSRYSDGIFQINKQENALYNRIQTFIKLGCVPESLKDFPVEFTPVDYVAKSIIKSIEYYNKSINVLHLYNPNHIIIEELVKIISKKSSVIPDEDFRNLIKQNLKDPNKRDIISSIINDMDSEFNLIYSSSIKLNNDFSTKFLEQIGFKWPKIDRNYIKLILYLFEL